VNSWRIASLVLFLAAATESLVSAQSLGTFRWQLRPYCNVVTLSVTQVGGLYRVEGSDDRCGAVQAGSVIGTAFMNPDGTVGLGLNVISAPSGEPQPVAAAISLASLSGTWSGGATSGDFVFTPGPGNGGPLRPDPPVVSIPVQISLRNDGGFLAAGTFQSGTIPASGAGVRLMWHPAKAAIRAGRVDATAWDNANIGNESAAFNKNTRATGTFSFAVNDSTLASGQASFAAGFFSTASGANSFATGSGTTAGGGNSFATGSGTTAGGANSVAIGFQSTAPGNVGFASGSGTQASGPASFAGGSGTVASGSRALAFGQNTAAIGDQSVALGLNTSAGASGSVALGTSAVAIAAATGSFVFADRSSGNNFTSFAPNEFVVRAAGGVGFYTNAATTTGVEMAANSSQWTSLSDVNTKHLFRDLDGEEVLSKLARMPIREWSYKAQDAAVRHVGPTAQDFKAAFGLGEYDLRIGTVDADGIALRAIQALEARTQSLMRENAALLTRLADLEARLTTAAGSPVERR